MKYVLTITLLLWMSITVLSFNNEDTPVRPFAYAIEHREDNISDYDLRVIDLNNPQNTIFSLSTDMFDCERGLSPDGQYLMYSQGDNFPSRHTGYLLNLTTLESIPQAVGIWSADSRLIAQTITHDNDHQSLVIYDVISETTQVIFEAESQLRFVQWAGDMLLFVHQDAQSNYTLSMYDVATDDLTEIASAEKFISKVLWTGDRIVFARTDQELLDIYSWDGNTLVHHLENQLQSGRSPIINFSPNGNYAIYNVTVTNENDRTHRQTYLLDLTHDTIINAGGFLNPVWHPDGNLLAYHQDHRVYLLDLITNEVILIRNDSRHYGKRWSPDGRYLSYKTSGEIFLYDLQTETSFSIIEVRNYELSIDGWLEWLSDTELIYMKAIGQNPSPSANSSDFVFYNLETDVHMPLTTTNNASYSCQWG